MYLKTTIISVCISFALTAFGYLLIPTSLALAGKKYDTKRIKRITLANCIVVWSLFRILQIALGASPTYSAAVFLWGAIGHGILKRHCLRITHTASYHITEKTQAVRTSLSDNDDTPRTYGSWNVYDTDVSLETNSEHTEHTHSETPRTVSAIFSQPTKYCSHCGQPLDSEAKEHENFSKQPGRNSTRKVVLTFLFVILLVISLAGNVILCLYSTSLNQALIEEQRNAATLTNTQKDRISELENNVDELTDACATYYEFWYENCDKLDTLDSWVVFIENDESNLYHKYECSKFLLNDSWAHNIEYAEYIGYNPCPLCFE